MIKAIGITYIHCSQQTLRQREH